MHERDLTEDDACSTGIPCTVGILTYNSGAFLERALTSVRACDDVLIADGGSTDDTIAIARRYGARVITQTTSGRISDFALERNNLLDHTHHNWFLYLDSDEAASPELIDEIRRITRLDVRSLKEDLIPRFFRVRWQYTDYSMKMKYRSFRTQYQIRLFDRTTGARFTKRIHEKIRPPEGAVIGTLQASWYTPLDSYEGFEVWKRKARRDAQIAQDWHSRNPVKFVVRCLFPPLLTTIKILFKLVWTRVRYPWAECLPVRYHLFLLYDMWYGVWAHVRRYMHLLRGLP